MTEDLGNLIQELRTEMEAKHTDIGKVKRLEDAVAEKNKEFEVKFAQEKEQRLAMEEKVNELKADYEAAYKLKSRLGVGASEEDTKGLFRKYSQQMNHYLHKGIEPESDLLDEVANEFVVKNLPSLDQKDVVEVKKLVSGNNPEGGYLIFPDQRTDFMVDRIFETSPMRAVSRVISTTSNEVELLINDDQMTSGGWVGEVDARPVTGTNKFGRLTIPVHEQYANPNVTQRMLDDASIDLEAFIAAETADIMTRDENTSFVVGDGASKPKGFVKYPAWAVNTTITGTNGVYERGGLEQVNSGVAGEITADGIIFLQTALKQAYQPNAVFMTKRVSFGVISTLKDGSGQYLLEREILSNGVTEMRLVGKPLMFADDMPESAADSLSVAYGDFGRGYTIVDRLGIRVLRDPYVNKPNVEFYTTKRVGGAVSNYEAIKLLKLAA